MNPTDTSFCTFALAASLFSLPIFIFFWAIDLTSQNMDSLWLTTLGSIPSISIVLQANKSACFCKTPRIFENAMKALSTWVYLCSLSKWYLSVLSIGSTLVSLSNRGSMSASSAPTTLSSLCTTYLEGDIGLSLKLLT